ncbi:MAG: ShlB/FhaC/HecB family hemolysin secretion/activation protein [Deltaproteobacteria bacterium]|nr:ShlB/FhaC/HecB family hemolysin secretion/activation protein [Deltaproteobacteria bacterium]
MLCAFFLFTALTAFAAGEQPDAVPRFDIQGYKVEGNTLLPAGEIDPILSPFTGKDRDFGTVQEAIDALEQAYRERGFSMVSVILPEQELEGGIVRLKVHENRIGKILIEGNRNFDESNIRRSLPALKTGETPNLNAVSRSLRLANENPSKSVNLQLANGEKENEIDANIKVADERPWKIGISADTTGDKETGRSRMGILAQHDNLFDRDQLLTLQYITSPEELDKVHIYSLGYRAPLYSLGASVDVIAAHSNVDSGTISAATDSLAVSGKGTILGLRYNQVLTRIGNYEHKLILGLDYRAYENDINFLGNQLGNNVTVHPLSLTYTGSQMGEKLNSFFYFTGLQNLPGNWDGRDTAEDVRNARFGAPKGYNILRYGVNLTYAVGADWQARALINGQYTNDPLVPGEQYGIGGATTVRGFAEREFANDRGYSGSVEIYSPDLSRLFGVNAFRSRLLAFYDRGVVTRVDPLPGETTKTEIGSIGPGLRITDGKKFSVSVDCGFVVDPPDENTTRWSSVWHLSASYLF